MTTKEVAKQLVALCKEGKFQQAQTELYSPYAVSIEPEGATFPEVTEGLENIQKKGAKWNEMVTKVHALEISDVTVAGDFISLKMKNDVEMQGIGRQQSEELVMYHVHKGKIISEQFYYNPNPSEN